MQKGLGGYNGGDLSKTFNTMPHAQKHFLLFPKYNKVPVNTLHEHLCTNKVFTRDQCFYLNYHHAQKHFLLFPKYNKVPVNTLHERLCTNKLFTRDQCFYLNYHKFSIKSYVLDVN